MKRTITATLFSVLFFDVGAFSEEHANTSDPSVRGVSTAGADEAQAILAKSGVSGGVIVHVGCGDGQMTGALRVSDAYVVHGLDTDAKAVEAARNGIVAMRHGGKLSAAAHDALERAAVPVSRFCCCWKFLSSSILRISLGRT